METVECIPVPYQYKPWELQASNDNALVKSTVLQLINSFTYIQRFLHATKSNLYTWYQEVRTVHMCMPCTYTACTRPRSAGPTRTPYRVPVPTTARHVITQSIRNSMVIAIHIYTYINVKIHSWSLI